jgi:hypothetical protein
MTRLQLEAEIIRLILDGSRRTKAVMVRELLVEVLDYIDQEVSGAGFIQMDGYGYWRKANPTIGTDTTGDIREGMVGSELQLQEYNGTTWDIRSTR